MIRLQVAHICTKKEKERMMTVFFLERAQNNGKSCA
jgi:hypothetical protein